MKYLVTGIVLSTILASVTGLLVTLSMSGTALADKAAFDDNVKQGGLGEYFSQDGRGGQSGQDFGQQVSTYARPGDHAGGHESFGVNNLGNNFALYASGECHAEKCE